MKNGVLHVTESVTIGADCIAWFSSIWWKDITSIGANLDINWFSQGVVKRIGCGDHTKFWSHVWVGSATLQERFPRLFSLSLQNESTVAELRWVELGIMNWNLLWRRRLFVWEENLVYDLLEAISTVVLSNELDRWGWSFNDGGEFTVKSTYGAVLSLFVSLDPIGLVDSKAFGALWKCLAPSKVKAFAWQLLLNRIPTRQNLLRRQIHLPEGEQLCVWCGVEAESMVHLFLYLGFARQVWIVVFSWLSFIFILPHNLVSIMSFFQSYPGRKNTKKGLVMIWSATVWALWKMRNSVIFENAVAQVGTVVDEVKFWAWKWWLSFVKPSEICLLYEWIAEPILCLDRSC
jgi:hypothetical protein